MLDVLQRAGSNDADETSWPVSAESTPTNGGPFVVLFPKCSSRPMTWPALLETTIVTSSQWKHWAICVVSSVAAAQLSLQVWPSLSSTAMASRESGPLRGSSPAIQIRPSIGRLFDADGLTPEESVSVAVYEAANRSVVNITSKSVRSGLLLETQSEGAGSGAIIDRAGHLVTNYHVVQQATQIEVSLFNGKTYEATLIGADRLNDLAVLRIDADESELFPVEFGDSRNLRVGMRAFALGNPFGLERTLTTGIISSLDRSLQIRANWAIKSIIQVDAAINPGSSGGPLLDAHGRLIGINTAIATTSGQSAGVGFAIPVSLVARVVPQLLQHGRVIRAETGITRVFQTEEGLLVAELRPNGPAAKVGLRGPTITRSRRGPFTVERVDRSKADLIVGVDSETVKTVQDFLSYIETKRPGDTVLLEVIRDGQPVQLRLQLSASEPETAP
jgi:S1-C subfamily serine protease